MSRKESLRGETSAQLVDNFWRTFYQLKSRLTLAVLLVSIQVNGGELDNWHWRLPSPTVQDITSLAFGGGIFVAVDNSGEIFHSPDGIVWESQKTPVRAPLTSVAFLNGRFVAVGDVVLTSDGGEWVQSNPGTTQPLNCVVAGNGWFVATSANGVNIRSQDGINWQTQSGAETPKINLLAFGEGLFVGLDYGYGTTPDSIWVSSDGLIWQSTKTFTPGSFFSGGLTYAFGTFYASRGLVDRFNQHWCLVIRVKVWRRGSVAGAGLEAARWGDASGRAASG